jgi:hypothetical protein
MLSTGRYRHGRLNFGFQSGRKKIIFHTINITFMYLVKKKLINMKSPFTRGLVFISKSLLWSVTLYAVCMLTVNWSNLYESMKHRQPHSVVQHGQLSSQAPVATVLPDSTASQSNVVHEPFFSGIISAIAGVRGIFGVITQ